MHIDLHFNKTCDELMGLDSNQLPFTYLMPYQDFLKKSYSADIIFACSPHERIFIIMSLIKNKFIRNIQFLSEPFKEYAPAEASLQRTFLDALIEKLIKNKVADRIVAPQNFIVFENFPQGSIKCDFGSYIIDLTHSLETIYNKIHPKHRNVIRNAENKNVSIKYGLSQLKAFYGLYEKTMERSNMYCEPLTYFETLGNTLSENKIVCGVAYCDEIPECALLMPYTAYSTYYLYGASIAKPSITGTMNFLHWETMKLMKNRKVNRYDFVGARLSDISNTKLEGIQNFKQRFGGQLKEGYMFKKDLSNFKCNIYDSLVSINNIFRGSKSFKDIIDQEIEKNES